MISTLILEFEKITKYPLTDFILKSKNFFSNSYSEIDRYFSGITNSIDNSHLIFLKEITQEINIITAHFNNFANKFSSCGYWELMEYLDELKSVIEKIHKLPKFKRTSLTKRGYQPVIQVESSVGGLKTVEDLADSVNSTNSENANWIDLMLANDFNEDDWDIEKLSSMTVVINTGDVMVRSILDQPIGKRIYGKDIYRKITFSNNDLLTVEYHDNIDQKCDILLEVNRGDVPEDKLFGKNLFAISGVNLKAFSYPELLSNIQDLFAQNDLFEYARVSNFSTEGDKAMITVEIKTKYDYKTEKRVTI